MVSGLLSHDVLFFLNPVLLRGDPVLFLERVLKMTLTGETIVKTDLRKGFIGIGKHLLGIFQFCLCNKGRKPHTCLCFEFSGQVTAAVSEKPRKVSTCEREVGVFPDVTDYIRNISALNQGVLLLRDL